MATKRTGILTAGTNLHATTSEEANQLATDFVTGGMVNAIGNTSGTAPMTGSFGVNAQGSPDMSVSVNQGTAYVSTTPTGQNTQLLRSTMPAAETVAIANNTSGVTKYDWLYIKHDPSNANNPDVNGTNVASFYVSRSSQNNSDDGTPPSYYELLSVLTVPNNATSITAAQIADRRRSVTIGTTSGASLNTGWNALGYTPNSVVYNGNRSYTLTFTGIDLRPVLAPGYRIRSTRSMVAPIQSTALNGTNQYWSRTSTINGMTFTDDWVTGAWIKPINYQAGKIMSRYNGTSGWQFGLEATGQVSLYAYNGSSGNFSGVTSYQSVQLNRWQHVAAQSDLSTFAPGITNSYVMIDGVDVPVQVTRGGSNPTALVQAGNLEVGGANGGTTPFAGSIAQAFVTSAKVAQSTINTYISQGLLGTEPNLVSAFSFSGNANDLNTTNGNNLTSNNGASATAADAPFGSQGNGTISATIDYLITQTVTLSGSDTVVVAQAAEGNTLPTTVSSIGSVDYSNAAKPYLFPGQERKWIIKSICKTLQAQAGPANGVWYNLNEQLTIPVGEWEYGYNVNVQLDKASATSVDAFQTLSASATAETDTEMTGYYVFGGASATITDGSPGSRKNSITVGTQAKYYLNVKTGTSVGTLYNRGDTGATVIYAKNGWL